jgi:hypothetical protein
MIFLQRVAETLKECIYEILPAENENLPQGIVRFPEGIDDPGKDRYMQGRPLKYQENEKDRRHIPDRGDIVHYELLRKKADDDVRPVKRRNGKKVEKRESYAEIHDKEELNAEVVDDRGRNEQRKKQPETDTGNGGTQDVYGGAGERNKHHVAFRFVKIVEIDRDGFGPAERPENHHDKSEQVKVRKRVQRQAARVFRRAVAAAERGPPVRIFVDGQRKKYRREYPEKPAQHFYRIAKHTWPKDFLSSSSKQCKAHEK